MERPSVAHRDTQTEAAAVLPATLDTAVLNARYYQGRGAQTDPVERMSVVDTRSWTSQTEPAAVRSRFAQTDRLLPITQGTQTADAPVELALARQTSNAEMQTEPTDDLPSFMVPLAMVNGMQRGYEQGVQEGRMVQLAEIIDANTLEFSDPALRGALRRAAETEDWAAFWETLQRDMGPPARQSETSVAALAARGRSALLHLAVRFPALVADQSVRTMAMAFSQYLHRAYAPELLNRASDWSGWLAESSMVASGYNPTVAQVAGVAVRTWVDQTLGTVAGQFAVGQLIDGTVGTLSRWTLGPLVGQGISSLMGLFAADRVPGRFERGHGHVDVGAPFESGWNNYLQQRETQNQIEAEVHRQIEESAPSSSGAVVLSSPRDPPPSEREVVEPLPQKKASKRLVATTRSSRNVKRPSKYGFDSSSPDDEDDPPPSPPTPKKGPKKGSRKGKERAE